MRERKRRNPLPIIIATFIAVVALVIGGIFLYKKLIFKPGTVSYDASVTEPERDFFAGFLTEDAVRNLGLSTNVEISMYTDVWSDNLISDNTLLYDILVPVADFYSTVSNLTTNTPEYSAADFISISALTPEQKLLSVDGDYYLDTFTSGANYRLILLSAASDSPNPISADDLTKLKDAISPHLQTFPSSANTLSLAQTGVTALSRAMVTKLNQVGDGAYFAANIADFLNTKDLTHISNEVSFATNCPGGTNTVSLCSDWRMLDTITAIGTDIVELTGNHNNDYSTQANLDSIAKYHELNLQTFGGGENETAAAQPLEIDQKGAKITLLGYNLSTSTKANGQGANGDQPGANIYDEAKAAQDISEAKARGDFVIVDVQYYECYSYPDEGTEMPACDAPISGQQELFEHLVDLGADMVIGTQAHQPQTYELYHGKPIYFGLGNIFFDQIYWPGTTRGYILTSYFVNGNYVQTRLSPTVYGSDLQVRLMNEAESQWFLQRLSAAR